LPIFATASHSHSLSPTRLNNVNVLTTLANGTFSRAPMQTLRNLQSQALSSSPEDVRQRDGERAGNGLADPVSRGILTMQDAQQLFDV
jgi:hypothetical protein